jgi:hypothetical protein
MECLLGGVECDGRLIVFVMSERALLCTGAGEGVLLIDVGVLACTAATTDSVSNAVIVVGCDRDCAAVCIVRWVSFSE